MATKTSSATVSAPSTKASPGFVTISPDSSGKGSLKEASPPPESENAENVEVNLPQPLENDASDTIIKDSQNSLLLNLKIEKNRVIPYTTFHIQNWQIEEIQNILKVKKLEKQINESIITSLYEVASLSQDNNELITSTLNSVEEEISSAEKIISAVQSLNLTYSRTENAYSKNTQIEEATKLLKDYIEALSIDEIYKADILLASDYQSLLSEVMSYPESALQDNTSTEFIIQVLKDLDFTLRVGLSPSFFIDTNKRTVHSKANDQTKHNYSDPWSNGVKTTVPSLRRLDSIGLKDYAGYDGILNSNPENRYPNLVGMPAIKNVMYHCSVISKEFLYSAGLGRLVGTPLGDKYGAEGEDSIHQLLGARTLKTLSTSTTLPPDAITNFLLTKQDANPNTSLDMSSKNVHILETHLRNVSNSSQTSSRDAWVNSVKSNPFDNKVDNFDSALQQLAQSFESSQEYLNKFLSLDEEKTLLTPRGLFTRVLKDFGTLLEAVTTESNDTIRKKALTEMALLSLAGQTSNGSDHSSIPYADKLLRRCMSFFIGIQSIIARGGFDDTQLEAQAGMEALDLGAADAIDEEANGLISISAKDNLKRSGLWSHTVKFKKNLKRAVLMTANMYNPEDPDQDPLSSREVSIKGTSLVDSFASMGQGENDSIGVESLIVKIFEDIQEEAHNLSQADGSSASYIRSSRTTRHSGFDGQIVMSALLNCFIQLVNTFVNIKLVLNLESSVGVTFWKLGVRSTTDPDPWLLELFDNGSHKIYFHASSNQGNPTNELRKFISALTNASDNNDFSNLINSVGIISTIPELNQNNNLADGPYATNGTVTPVTLIDAMIEMSKEDSTPSVLFGSAKSVVDSMYEKFSPLVRKASALKSSSSTGSDSEDIKTLKSLKTNPLAISFLEGITDSQIGQAKKRLLTIKNSGSSPYIVSPLKETMFKIYNMFLENKKDKFSSAAIIFIGLPGGSIEDELVKQSILKESAVLNISVVKTDESTPNLSYNSKLLTFFLEKSVTIKALDEAMNAIPAPSNLDDLLAQTNFNIPGGNSKKGSEIIGFADNPSQVRKRLMNALESTILKSMYQELTNTPIEVQRVLVSPLASRSEKVVNISQALMSPIIKSKDTVSKFYTFQGGNVEMPDSTRKKSLVQPQVGIISGSAVYKNPLMTLEQLEAMYILQSTRPFFIDRVEDIVFSESIFDRTEGLFIDLNDFDVDTLSSEGNLNASSAQSKATEENLDKFSLPTLFIGASLLEGT